MNTVKIKNTPYIRDLHTNAILHNNPKELDEFNTRRHKILLEKQEKEETKKRLSKIEQDMMTIQSLLQELLQLRTSNGN